MPGSLFQERLQREYEARKEKNPRYSLRAYAAFLGVENGADHSTLSQIMRQQRRVPAIRIRSWAKKLGMTQEEAALYIAAEHVPDAATAGRHEQLRHWTAEAIGILSGPAHYEILRLSHIRGFKADTRWIARETGSTVDDVNVALSRLLRLRLLEIKPNGKWKDLTGLKPLTEHEFRKLALTRVREKAAEDKVSLR